jgi:hypothetical protein
VNHPVQALTSHLPADLAIAALGSIPRCFFCDKTDHHADTCPTLLRLRQDERRRAYILKQLKPPPSGKTKAIHQLQEDVTTDMASTLDLDALEESSTFDVVDDDREQANPDDTDTATSPDFR